MFELWNLNRTSQIRGRSEIVVEVLLRMHGKQFVTAHRPDRTMDPATN
jgi:hypothetical protein